MSEETLISTFTELRTRFLKVAMRFLPSADDADDDGEKDNQGCPGRRLRL